MSRYLRYKGSDYILGEIVKECAFYYLVKRTPTKEDPSMRLVSHPKWSTEVVKESELT